jgi:hypothetical protein
VLVAWPIVAVAKAVAGKELGETLSELELRKEKRHWLENWTLSDVPLEASVRYLVEVEHKPEQVSHRFAVAFQSQNLWPL